MTKRFLAMLLAVIMIVGLLPMNVFAGTAADRTKYQSQTSHTNAHVCEHCVAAGKSEAEAAAVTWIAWDDTSKLPTNGTEGSNHYYLSSDQPYNVTAAEITAGHVVLCLNGKTVTASGTSGNANDRFYTLKNGGSLTILDCTAQTVEENGEKVYKAGTLTGGSASGIMFQDSTASVGSLNIYDGVFTGNSRSSAGGAICVQGNGKLNIYGGEFSENSTGTNGGAIYLHTANNTAHIEDAVFKGNHATGSAGVLYSNGATVVFKNTVMSGNYAPSVGVIVSKSGPITYENVTITENRTTSGAYGAIHQYNSASSITLKGNTKIINNYYGATGTQEQRNLWLRNHGNKVIVSDSSGNLYLSGDAMIGLSFDSGKKTATNGNQYITTKLVNDIDPRSFFSCDNAEYKLEIVDAGGSTGRRMVFADIPAPPEHPHKICADSTCTEHTTDVEFTKWGATEEEKKTLPVSGGNYYLVDDIALDGAKVITGDLNLCLNGHTITAKSNTRHMAVSNGVTMSITDCGANGGKIGVITGGTYDYGGSVNVNAGGTLNLYEGIFSGNQSKNLGSATGQGGAIYLQATKTVDGVKLPGGVLNMYGGQIGAEGKPNKANRGAAIHACEGSTLNVYGGKIAYNEATDAALYLTKATSLLKDVQITNNKGTNASAACVFGGSCTLDGAKIQNNTQTGNYGAVHLNRSGDVTLEVKGETIIDGNTRGADKIPHNLHMRQSTSALYVKVGQLTGNAKVSITMENARLNANNLQISSNDVTEAQAAFLHSDNSSYTVKVINGKARLTTGHDHKVCVDAGCADGHSELSWVKWTDTTKLPTSAGNYYLDVDVQLKTTTWTGTNKNINLCLNGHTVTAANGARLISVQQGTVMSITDCQGTGVLTGGNSTFGGGINVNAGATLNLYAGTISDNHSDDEASGQGGAIYLQAKSSTYAGGILNMYGGTISDNTAHFGAGVYGRGGSQVNIYGGTIAGNTAGNYGGGVYTNEGAAVVIENAVFEGNEAAVNGGAVYMTGANAKLTVKDSAFEKNTAKSAGGAILAQSTGTVVTITGSVFTGNHAPSGGAAYISTNTTLTITDAAFTGNTANNGAALYTAAASTTLEDVEITGNTSAYNGAVYMNADAGTLTLKGNVKILSNLADGRANNLYLVGDELISMDALTDDAKIGISVEKYDRVISTQNDTDFSKNFVSDSPYRVISYKDKALYLANSTEHQHCTCAGAAASGCEHGSIVWLAWEKTGTLPTAKGHYYLTKDVVMTNQIWIANKDITICLNGHTVTAAEGKRLISVQEGTVLNITDCRGSGKLTGGNSTFGGAVNVNAGGTLNLFGGTFTGNQSNDAEPLPEKVTNMKGQGGAIYLQAGKDGIPGGVLNMYGGTITGNKASLGGGIYASANSQLNIYGGTISNNEAAQYGGGTYSSGGITTNIANAKLEGNTAYTGGAMYVTGGGSKLNIQNTTFRKNTVKSAGGAILAQSTGTVIDINGCTFTGNVSNGSGGAVYASSNTTLKLDNTVFTGNTAEQGACLYALRVTSTIGKVTMEGNKSASTKETPTLRAAGIYVSGGEMTLDGTVIKNNQGGSGTAITTGVAKGTVDGKEVSFYPTINFVSGTISGNKGTSGGAILLQSKTVFNMKSGKISGNSASYGGAIYVSTNATFNMTGGTISGNSAKENGGAIYALRSTVNLKSGTISGNTAVKMGGAIFLSAAQLYQSGAYICGNKTDTGTGGGAIATGVKKEKTETFHPYIKISGGTITDNYGRHGGAILLQGNAKTVLDMTGGKITNNQGKVDGGAIYGSTHTTINMTGGTITGNTCEGRAGAIFHNNSKGNYTGVEIFDNTAKTSGGAVMLNGATTVVKMKDTKIYDCSAATGGAIVNQGKARMTLEKVEIYNCHTTTGSGGAVYVSYNTYLDIIDSNIHDCQSKTHGGGAYFANHTYINVDGLTLQNNTAEAEGGGIYTRGASSFYKNMKLIGNKAGVNGGGICAAYPALQGVTGMIVKPDFKTGNVMENVEFANNNAVGQAGGLYVHKGTFVTLKNGTFTGNTSGVEGSAVYALGDFIMNGLTATGNTSKMDGYAIYLADVEYDGQSYTTGQNRMAGDVIVKDNQGGDLYMGDTTTIAILAEGIGEKTEIHVTLASGVLTNKIQGAYHYEGGDLVYVVTYGDRSLTQPEYDEALANANKEDSAIGDVLLYTGVGVFVLAIAAVVILLILKKKKKAPAAETASE